MSAQLPIVTSITATCGRHTLLERSIRCFLDQDYLGQHNLLIYNNSIVPQELAVFETPENKRIILVNNNIDSATQRQYSTLGGIYNDALQYVPLETDLVIFSDDDDIFLPNHITEGVKGYLKAKSKDKKYKAYKPNTSFFRHANGILQTGNRLEPSIFVEYTHVFDRGFSLETTAQHMGWLGELEIEGTIFIDVEGVPTLIYNWGDVTPTFKTSGNPAHPTNFENYREFSQDHGDGIITPISEQEAMAYYQEVKQINK